MTTKTTPHLVRAADLVPTVEQVKTVPTVPLHPEDADGHSTGGGSLAPDHRHVAKPSKAKTAKAKTAKAQAAKAKRKK